MKLTSAFMKKHLILYNKMIRAETYFQVAKMKADRVQEVFKRDFREIKSGKDGKTFYAPKKYEIDLDSNDEFIPKLKELSKDLHANKPKTTEKGKISIPNEKIKKRKFIVKRKTKDGKVIEAKKEELHPEGIHLHINWKDGEKELKRYKTQKAGENDFKKIRADRKKKRDYKSMKLMDGKHKVIEYSA